MPPTGREAAADVTGVAALAAVAGIAARSPHFAALRRRLDASLLARLSLAWLTLAAAACASRGGGLPTAPPAASAGLAEGQPAPPAAGAAGAVAVWEVPPAAYGTQTLYRLAVKGEDGQQGNLKLTLRLAAPRRYQAQAADPLGRALWSLDVDGGKGLWLDHRARLYCRLEGGFDLAILPLGRLSLAALPALLLGRLPEAPADPSAVRPQRLAGATAAGGEAEQIAYDDAAGRRWSALLRHGQPVSWGLREAGANSPLLAWTSNGDWAVLTDRRKGIEVRWHQTLRETLHSLAPLTPPADYRPGACAPGG